MPKTERQKRSREQKRRWARARKAEMQFGRKLRGIAHEIDLLVKRIWKENDPAGSMERLRAALARYSAALDPWARQVAANMVFDVERRDNVQWNQLSSELGRRLQEELETAPTGDLLRQRLEESARLITSLPIDAAKRVHHFTLKGLEEGQRPETISEEIYKTGQVTKSRADLIARTEVARTASGLVQTRAEHLGSTGYIWRTSGDDDVRPRHRKLNGKFFRWDDPPIAGESGERAHAGQIYNCRCWCEPVIPEEEDLSNRFRAEAA